MLLSLTLSLALASDFVFCYVFCNEAHILTWITGPSISHFTYMYAFYILNCLFLSLHFVFLHFMFLIVTLHFEGECSEAQVLSLITGRAPVGGGLELGGLGGGKGERKRRPLFK